MVYRGELGCFRPPKIIFEVERTYRSWGCAVIIGQGEPMRASDSSQLPSPKPITISGIVFKTIRNCHLQQLSSRESIKSSGNLCINQKVSLSATIMRSFLASLAGVIPSLYPYALQDSSITVSPDS